MAMGLHAKDIVTKGMEGRFATEIHSEEVKSGSKTVNMFPGATG